MANRPAGYAVVTFFIRMLSLAATTALPIILHGKGLSDLVLGYCVSAVWVGSGVGTIFTLIKPISLTKASWVGFGLVALSFFLLIFDTDLPLFALLGFGLSLIEIPAMNEASRSGQAGIFSYYSSLSLATLVSSFVMPALLYLGPVVALSALAAMSLLAAPMGRGNAGRRGLSLGHFKVFTRNFVALFAFTFFSYMGLDFVWTFYGVRLMDLGYPEWESQAAFFLLFLGSFVVRWVHPIRAMDARLLAFLSFVSMVMLLMPMPIPLLGLSLLGLSHGLLPVMIALRVAKESPEDFATLNVMVLSSSGFASFLAPLIGGSAVVALGFPLALIAFSVMSLPMAASGLRADAIEG